MSTTSPSARVENLWDRDRAHSLRDDLDRLVYASNLLGSDPRVTNFGGGNTSVKTQERDPLTDHEVEVLWVKGSGGDLGSATRANFASLYQDKVLALEERVRATGLHEDDVVELYRYCTFGLNPTACSIDTPLHAFVPFKAVSHMHSDAVIALAAAENAREAMEAIYGSKMGFLPWKRPGFDLGLALRDLIRAQPGIQGALMESHGFICWADDWETCYALTLEFINRAVEALEAQRGSDHPFGDLVLPRRRSDTRAAWLSLLPELRGKVTFQGARLIAHVDESDAVLDFLSRSKMPALARLGTSCPDHFLRTKIRPLVLDPENLDLDGALGRFREEYAAYYERCKRPDSPAMRNPNPSVVLIPGLGMVSFGKNPQEAEVTGRFYLNAIAVMEGAETLSRYVALPEQEAFDIEYWLLEEAKLRRMPAEKSFSRRVAVITGAAQGIGLATAKTLAAQGACVVLLDINEARLSGAVEEVQGVAGSPRAAIGVPCDVTDTTSLSEAFEAAVLRYGGVDIAVVNAGNARRGTVADTTDADYEFLSDLLMRGYFQTMRAASQLMIRQGIGGSIVVVASKNGVAVGSNAAIYSAAKSFELHLMRCAAVDHAPHGIRCNAINPDAVLQGSAIWSDQWREETAKLLGIHPDELQDHYKNRTLLKRTVSPEDCAAAIAWLAGDSASRTTGATIPVDAGVREGFLR
ncbi:MAG TPA: bifunctional rhamnulose-1-phosphate aldolase/short-chain dehydrogenase [Fimbriimonadaceae bacterium]|nr:bifunctional rhamnulose-1-phosphate aldolase/short-chain dehydrogenase [Fimbriimonadaceae bacterium]